MHKMQRTPCTSATCAVSVFAMCRPVHRGGPAQRPGATACAPRRAIGAHACSSWLGSLLQAQHMRNDLSRRHAGQYTAVDLYSDLARLRARRAAALASLQASGAQVLVVPTVMHHYLVSEVQQQENDTPGSATFNAHLGLFTNFVNLLGMCAISVPAGALPPAPVEVRTRCCAPLRRRSFLLSWPSLVHLQLV